MDHQEKVARLKMMLQQVAPDESIEAIMPLSEGSVESNRLSGTQGGKFSDKELAKAASGLQKMQEGREQDIDFEEAHGLEAIILPRERPVFFITGGNYPAMGYPWTQLNDQGTRARLRAAIASVGRVELPSNPRIPYGGTGFLVGEGLLMTNRHVAEIFVDGLGVKRLRFKRGDAAVDFRRERDMSENGHDTYFDVLDVVMVHPYWDMALLRIAGLPASYRPLTLATDELANGTDIVSIGYPARDDRNDLAKQDRIFEHIYNVKRLQPGKMRSRARIRSFESIVNAATHDSSTLGGSSGSAIIDPATGNVVALHFAGIYLKANYAVPALELARDARVVAEGVHFAGNMPATDEWDDAWRRAGVLEQSAPVTTSATSAPPANVQGNITWTIPLQVTVSIGAPAFVAASGPTAPAPAVVPSVRTESMRVPVIYDGLEDRAGYDADFLEIPGNPIPMLAITDLGRRNVATLEGGSHELKYHRFSVVMHKRRRIALYTAANVDWREPSRQINGAKLSRRQLTGLGDGDIEKWVTDWRISEEHQLPDIFYTKDGGAFDKGHLVRRDDVAWGDTFRDIQMANGDTYHTTNCSPQVGSFNQSSRGVDNWGDLENMVQQATNAEKAIVFSGPVLAVDDRLFEGRGDGGISILARVPRCFWKIIVVKGEQGPAAFGFVLEQDLSHVATREEITVPPLWKPYMKPLAEIEEMLFGLADLGILKDCDQYGVEEGVAIRAKL